jgi:hypothetical protein
VGHAVEGQFVVDVGTEGHGVPRLEKFTGCLRCREWLHSVFVSDQ